MSQIDKSTMTFLKKIVKNNNREWFHAHKDVFTVANNNMKDFMASVETELNKFDSIEKKKLFRIYRDVRFSKDKTPYNGHFSLSFGREGPFRRGGYYMRIKPGESMIGGGFYKPNPSDLKLIRSHLDRDAQSLKKVLSAKKFKNTFGELRGDTVKSAPRGFAKDHPNIDLLRYKSMYVFRDFNDKDVTAPGFIKEVIKTYQAIQPWFEYMTDILTHDLDGVPLYK